jgi:hypothetical protein
LDEEGSLLEDVVALRSSEWLRWADDFFGRGRKSTPPSAKTPERRFALIDNCPVLLHPSLIPHT